VINPVVILVAAESAAAINRDSTLPVFSGQSRLSDPRTIAAISSRDIIASVRLSRITTGFH
jgi:hypothetical protein